MHKYDRFFCLRAVANCLEPSALLFIGLRHLRETDMHTVQIIYELGNVTGIIGG